MYGLAVHQGVCHFKKKKKEKKKGMEISFQKFEYVIITPQVELYTGPNIAINEIRPMRTQDFTLAKLAILT